MLKSAQDSDPSSAPAASSRERSWIPRVKYRAKSFYVVKLRLQPVNCSYTPVVCVDQTSYPPRGIIFSTRCIHYFREANNVNVSEIYPPEPSTAALSYTHMSFATSPC